MTNTDLVRAASEEISEKAKRLRASASPMDQHQHNLASVYEECAAIISRHITESDFYRAGVAACVEKANANPYYACVKCGWSGYDARDGHGCSRKPFQVVAVANLESLTDSAPTVAAQPEVNSSELLPCPFCGRHNPRLSDTGDDPFFVIKCADCPCCIEFFSSTRNQAIERWNTRAHIGVAEGGK